MNIKKTTMTIDFADVKALTITRKKKSWSISMPYKSEYKKQWHFQTITKKPRSTHTHIRRLNPIPGWYNNIKWDITEKFLKLTGKAHTICGGCGCGIAKWRIDDPNYPINSGKRFTCCDGCVNFYDWHWSQRPIHMGTSKDALNEFKVINSGDKK